MSFNSETGRIGGQKSKRGKAKKLEPNIKEKMELLYEEVLDHLIMHQDELSNADRVRLVKTYLNPNDSPTEAVEYSCKLYCAYIFNIAKFNRTPTVAKVEFAE